MGWGGATRPLSMDSINRYTYGGGVLVDVATTEADGGKLVIRKAQDITQNIEFCKAYANSDEWSRGVKKSWALAGHIPDITIVELRQIGVDVFRAPLKEIRAGLKKLGKEGFVWKT